MRLEDMSIAVRTRSVYEVMDLGLLMLRRSFIPLGLLVLINVAPWIALNTWLISDIRRDGGALYVFALLLYIQTPFIFAPMTAYIGLAMFSEKPTILQAMRMTSSRFFALLMVMAYRAICGLTVVGILWSAPHVNEALLLERLSLKRAFKRAFTLQNAAFDRQLTMLLLAGVCIAIAGWTAFGTVSAIVGLFTTGQMFDPEAEYFSFKADYWLLVFATVAAVAYMTVVRFAAYIDLRTRREGWDIELDFKQSARRYEHGLQQ
jgi:hypothetical protein